MELKPRLPRHREAFYHSSDFRPIEEFHDLKVRPPIVYHRATGFKSVHLASFDAVREILPSNDLHPLRWLDGRAMLGVMAFCYEHVSVEMADGTIRMLAPYGEIGVTALVSRRPSRVPGLGLLQAAVGSAHGFILDLPVTTAEALDAGRQIWGMPKFVADMDFTEEPDHRSVKLWEEDAHILTLKVRTGGPVIADHAPLTTYSVLHGQLVETTIRFHGHRQAGLGANAGRITLGQQHPVAHRLRALDVADTPLVAASYLSARLALPAGLPTGAAREYVGHLGRDRERGRLTLTYPGAGPIDLYSAPGGIRQKANLGLQP